MKHLTSPISYREDINGLRAWAVVVVLLYHFRVPGFSAGFMGVDLFFVISGYLMTAIVTKGLERGDFSLSRFYVARVRRIVPALLVLLVALLALGWFWLVTPDYHRLGEQAKYALGFFSNIFFYRSTGYFDTEVYEKWLVHTWTLGVEFQFYLLYPLLLLMLWKLKADLRFLLYGIGLVFVASLTFSVMMSYRNPPAAFYLLQGRAWEFLAGALSLLLRREFPAIQRKGRALLWGGMAFWLAALLILDKHFPWPSAWALLPVLAGSLVIVAQQERSMLTVNPLMQWLGDRSYSLYLWHWPVVVGLYFVGVQGEPFWISAGIGLSLMLAELSYRFVEIPTRLGLPRLGASREAIGFAVLYLLIATASIGVQKRSFDNRFSAEVELVANESENRDPRRHECAPVNGISPGCTYGQGEVGVLLLGDSHAMSSITSLAEAGRSFDRSAMFLGKSGCPTIKGLRKTDDDGRCLMFNNWLLTERLNGSPGRGVPVVLISRTTALVLGWEDEKKLDTYFDEPVEVDGNGFAEYVQGFESAYVETACDIQRNRQVYLVRPTPEFHVSVPDRLARNIMLRGDSSDITITLDEYHKRHRIVWDMQDKAARQCGVRILDPLPYLCDERYCYGSRDGRSLYFDADHLSEYGNTFLVPMFERVFADMRH